MRQKRYDAISGVYNLLLDEELKSASKSNDEKITHIQETQENSVIRVSIKSTTESVEKETGDQNGVQHSESRSATSSEGPDSQAEAEQEWEQVSTLRHIVHKPKLVV